MKEGRNYFLSILLASKYPFLGFPGGSVVKNPPANARDMGLILDPGDPTCCRAAKPMHHNY